MIVPFNLNEIYKKKKLFFSFPIWNTTYISSTLRLYKQTLLHSTVEENNPEVTLIYRFVRIKYHSQYDLVRLYKTKIWTVISDFTVTEKSKLVSILLESIGRLVILRTLVEEVNRS